MMMSQGVVTLGVMLLVCFSISNSQSEDSLPLDVREYVEVKTEPTDGEADDIVKKNDDNSGDISDVIGAIDGELHDDGVVEPVVHTSTQDEQNTKVPLREILLRMKPDSLKDDDEEVTSSEEQRFTSFNGSSTSNLVKPGTADDLTHSTTSHDKSNSKTKGGSRKAECAPANTTHPIQLLNATGLQALVSPSPNISTRSTPGPCTLVYFFNPRCQFSVNAAPHINALQRQLEGAIAIYGVDSWAEHVINAQYGVMGTPSLLLFHSGNSVGYYNASVYDSKHMASFLEHLTSYKLNEDYNLTQEDYKTGPLPLELTPSSKLPVVCASFFLLSVAFYCFVRSNLFEAIFEAVLNSWREAEAHQHQD